MGQFIDFPEDQNEQITDVTIVDEDDNSTEGNEDSEKSGEQLLLEALERYKNPDNAGDYSVDEDEDDDQDSESDEDESNDTDEEDEDEEEYTPNQEKSFKTQQNAVNAERRRQEQQRKLDDFRQTTPEYQIISQLANQRGVSPEQMLQEVQEAMLTQQAQQQGIPVEVARQLHEANQRLRELENQTALREYQDWENRISSEASVLKNSYPFLTDQDIDSAKNLLLNTWRNVEAPLEQAVYALHGKKILEQGQESSRTETLAEVSGRKSKSGVPLKAGKSSDTQILTDDEKYIARQMGISEEVYLKNKR